VHPDTLRFACLHASIILSLINNSRSLFLLSIVKPFFNRPFLYDTRFIHETCRGIRYCLCSTAFYNLKINRRMKQFYSTLRHLKPAKTLLLSAFFSCAFYLAGGQTYYTTLSGPNEEPPNASPGTGKAVLTISGNFMTLQTTFSGLLGTTTVSHIHAPTPVAGAGTAPVATQTPSFVGFPVGVTAGSYTQTFDMTMASSYRPGYITANGGTPAGAFAALKTALNEGKAYLNIHTALFPGGEIRGFFTLCPTIMVTIPNAFALPQGVLPNTVYPAYAPASSLMLTANASGGTGPYSYSWSNGSSAQTLTVSPTSATPYTVTVRDQNGCPGTASTMVNVVDVSGGK
jgi:hypothetical protein